MTVCLELLLGIVAIVVYDASLTVVLILCFELVHNQTCKNGFPNTWVTHTEEVLMCIGDPTPVLGRLKKPLTSALCSSGLDVLVSLDTWVSFC